MHDSLFRRSNYLSRVFLEFTTSVILGTRSARTTHVPLPDEGPPLRYHRPHQKRAPRGLGGHRARGARCLRCLSNGACPCARTVRATVSAMPRTFMLISGLSVPHDDGSFSAINTHMLDYAAVRFPWPSPSPRPSRVSHNVALAPSSTPVNSNRTAPVVGPCWTLLRWRAPNSLGRHAHSGPRLLLYPPSARLASPSSRGTSSGTYAVQTVHLFFLRSHTSIFSRAHPWALAKGCRNFPDRISAQTRCNAIVSPQSSACYNLDEGPLLDDRAGVEAGQKDEYHILRLRSVPSHAPRFVPPQRRRADVPARAPPAHHVAPSGNIKTHISRRLQSPLVLVQHCSALALAKCLIKYQAVLDAFAAVHKSVSNLSLHPQIVRSEHSIPSWPLCCSADTCLHLARARCPRIPNGQTFSTTSSSLQLPSLRLPPSSRSHPSPTPPQSVQSCTIIGWLPARADAGLSDFHENEAFREVLHEAIRTELVDGDDNVLINSALQTQEQHPSARAHG